ncbi:MAG: TOBE domain-containing protein [Oscillospiraceae bacterium]
MNSIVRVAIEGGNTITSVISIASVKELGLKEGQDVYVVIKATSVMVGVED